ncbi:hypothetical protein [Novosphingobium sp. JCM 18896]|uniref:hypothetical protein n=1 Tax=Novosphingobium sp. JCM 18896 TaxID=2989731 RepID=UPI002223CCE5|nr:hypothetical protein [Novosphingobium sp. JCM 18896]MCW1432103.1 hypothetical protein [Novosphingobium sp. JCM 18896]
MAKDLEVPMELFSSIPEDADEFTKRYMRAHTVIQSAFFSLGDLDVSPGEATLGYAELENILCMAQAMLIAGDDCLKTKRDVRLRAEEHAKIVRSAAEMLKEAGDRQAIDLLDMMRLRKSSPTN